MRIGFDASACEPPHSLGVRRVARQTLAALEARGTLGVVRLAPPPGSGLRAWRAKELPRRVAGERLDGLHSFTSAFAVRARCKRVQTIHELPWRHGASENAGWKHRAWAALGPLVADRVVCPTAHVARDLAARLLPGKDKVRVVPWGVDARFEDEPPPGVVDEVVLERYRLGGDPLILCLGAVRAKKNLAAVLEGAARLYEEGRAFELVVTGPDTPDLRRDLGLASRLGLAGRVTTLSEVDEDDLPSLLRLAAVVPVLSSSEGFALPVLEALACGTPVVVPPDSAQLEVAGEHAIVVDPRDPSAVADGLRDALARREELRYVVGARAREFTWDATAARIEAVWSELA